MPGLFGVLALSSRTPDERVAAMARRMAESMETTSWLRTELWEGAGFAGGRVHLAVANPESQPQSSAGGLKTWFDGRIYPRDGLGGVTPPADTVVAMVRDPRHGLAGADGVFHLACFDPDSRSLTLATDRLGFRPLYWTATPDWFAYAGEAGALLAIRDAQPRLDERALRQFFAFDYLLGERTWWEGIELLPPASVWQVSGSGVDRCRYWRFAEIRRDPRPDAEVAEELDRLWSRAIRQRTEPGTTPVLLSGGLDSRLVLSELVRQRADVSAVTFGERGCPDVSIAQRCAAEAHVPHRIVAMNDGNWWDGRDAAIRRTDGLVNAIHLHVAVALDALATGNRHSLKNSTGDVLFGGSGFSLFPTQAFAPAGARDWTRAREEFLTRKYAPNPFFSADETTEASRSDCDPYLEGPSTDSFVIHQGQRRWTLTGALSMSGHCEVVNPGASLAILTLMLGSLSDSARAHSRLYRRFLCTHHPELFRSIPWQKTGRRLAESSAVRMYYRIDSAIRQRLGRYRRPRPFFDYGRAVAACRLRAKLADGDLLVDDVLHGAARRSLRADRSLSTKTLLAVVTLETYLRQTSGRSALSLV
jgi:asparagine synthase (glutamine-hydrolysing)